MDGWRTMKVIIAGSRNISDMNLVRDIIRESEFDITEVVCGGCVGVDKCGEQYAKENGIPIIYFYPDWKTLGRAAGPIRNKEMANYAEALIAIWDGSSRGTLNMISEAKLRNLKIYSTIN